MRVAALALLLASTRSWAYASVSQLLQESKLVVAGEVVEVRTDAKGKPVARLKIAHLYKGEPGAEVIDLPFKTETTWGCDFTITYAKGKKYLLLLDDKHDFRVVYYPSRTHEEIDAYQGGYPDFVQIAVDVLDGVHSRLPDLMKLAEEKKWKEEALQLFRVVPRSVARAHLPAIRRLHPGNVWDGEKMSSSHPEWGRYCAYGLPANLEITRDLSMISLLLKAERDNQACPIEETLSLLTGWMVTDLETFKVSWEKAIRRAGARGEKTAVAELVKKLSSADPGERDQAFSAILDLGPDVQEAVKEFAGIGDIEARARVRALIRELELLQDLRSDLAPRARR